MRLLIFLDTDHVSGPARLALDFARLAVGIGHEVLMLGLVRGPAPQPTAFSRAVESAGLPAALLHERFRFDPSIRRQFRQILNDFRPQVYQSHGYKGSALGRLAQRGGAVWQAMFHGFTWENWRVRLYHRLDVDWLRRADEVLTVSRPFRDELARRGVPAGRLRWLPNAIDEQALRASDSGLDLRPQWAGPAGSDVLLGAVGRFSPEKGPDHFLQAFSKAAAQAPALRAVMVGDGPQLDACRRLARQLGVEGRVTFAGFRADLAAVYRALDGLVIASRSEGMPTVMIEAMILGAPVLSTRVGAVPDILTDGHTGLLADIGDVEGLADGMLRLARQPELRKDLAAAAGDLARRRLTLEERTRTILRHAECLLGGQPLPPPAGEAET